MISVKHRLLIILSVFSLLATTSCEYNLDKENIIDLEPPTSAPVFDLNIVSESDTIKVFEKRDLSYNINTNGLDIYEGTFSLKGKSWKIYSPSYSITIEPDDFEPGLDTLKLVLYTNSGTGSIADNIGAEVYKIEKKWLISIDGRPAPELIPQSTITAEGYLKISWPKCDQANFYCYELYADIEGNYISKDIYDANQTCLIDSDFVAGEVSFRVNCRTVNDHTWGNYVNYEIEPSKLFFEDLGWDSLRIYWNKSDYNAKYVLHWDTNTKYFPSRNDTTVTIPHVGFAKYTEFTLNTTSNRTKSWPAYYSGTYNIARFVLGTHFADNWPRYGYNFIDKALYTNGYSYMGCYDPNDYSLKKSVYISGLLHEGLYSCPTNSTKVAASSDENAYIFANRNLTTPTVIPYNFTGAYSIDHFLLTNNDKLAVARKGQYLLFDAITSQLILSVTLPDYPGGSQWATISTSQDAKYLSVVTQNGIRIYNIENGTLTETYTDNRGYYSCYFDPNNPNRLFLTVDTKKVEIRDPSNFSLIDEFDTPTITTLQNIDPETGYLLLTNFQEVFIYDIQSHTNIYKLKCSDWKPYMYNKTLYTHNGYYLNISSKLGK